MLVPCPECNLQVSTSAIVCPHCGYPLKNQQAAKTYHRPAKRRRLPNGFGQIAELKNPNLRKPFRAMITVGKTPNGRSISQPLRPQAYFESYNDAYAALLEYHKNPYDLAPSITIQELHDRWWKEYSSKDKTPKSLAATANAWKYAVDLYEARVSDVRARHIKKLYRKRPCGHQRPVPQCFA